MRPPKTTPKKTDLPSPPFAGFLLSERSVPDSMHKYPKPKKKFRPTEEEKAKARARAAARSRMSKAELILDDARHNPSKTCHDRRQLTFDNYLKHQAFAKLDEVIAAAQKP
jgi:hypothetical protein